MKKSISLFLLSLFSCTVALADLYKTSFQAPNNRGGLIPYGFVVDLQVTPEGSVTGEVKDFFGASSCRWPGTKLTGRSLADSSIHWVSEENVIRGCGKLVFVGKKEDDKFVGHLPRFQGVKVNLELEPVK